MRNIYTALLTTTGLMLAGTSMAQRPDNSGGEGAQTIRPAHIRGQQVSHVNTARGGAAPANDECTAAQPIAIVPIAECATSLTTGNNIASIVTTGDPGCDETTVGYQDVWYSFNSGTSSAVKVELINGDAGDLNFSVQTTCDLSTEIACEIGPFVPIDVPVTPNTDYIIRVFSNLQYGNGGEFTLCISDAPFIEPPANDVCTAAVNQDLAVGSSVTFTGDNTGAMDNGEGLNTPAVWEMFTTAACANLELTYCGTTPTFGNAFVNIFTGCPYTGFIAPVGYDDTSCGDGNISLFFEGVPAGVYYYPVMLDAANNAVGPYNLTVTATACAPAPLNDECPGAILLTPASVCNPVAGTSAAATQTMDPILCNGATSTNAKDVWYAFTATTTSDSILVEGIDDYDAVIEVFSGACGSLTSLACEDGNFPTGAPVTERMFITGLTIGSTYYVRVYDYGHGSTDHNFNICVKADVGSGIGETAEAVFTYYPNPTQGDLTISSVNLRGRVDCELTDMTGRVVYTDQHTMSLDQPVTLPLNGKLARGTYTLRVITASGTSCRPVMIR